MLVVLVLIIFFVIDRRLYVLVFACLCVLAFLLCVCVLCVFVLLLEFLLCLFSCDWYCFCCCWYCAMVGMLFRDVRTYGCAWSWVVWGDDSC